MVEVPPSIAISTSRFVTDDGLTFLQRSWLPASSRRGTMILVHGYAEHSGRYDELARYLCGIGLEVRAFDQRGAGDSDGRRGRIERFGKLVDDLRQFVERVGDEDRPRFIFGQSLGGVLTLDYLLSDGAHEFDGVIVTSPAIRIATPFPDQVVRLLKKLAPLAPALPTVPLDRSGLSRDPAVVSEAMNDSSNFLGRVSLKTAMQMLEAGPRVLSRAHLLALPILIIVGTGDIVVEPEGSFELYGAAGSDDMTLAIYEGLYHETFREPEKEIVMDGIRLWLEERLPAIS